MSPLRPEVLAAYECVESMVPRADGEQGGGSWWFGWALREAFLAGVQWQRGSYIVEVDTEQNRVTLTLLAPDAEEAQP